jgi:hypothetical protein
MMITHKTRKPVTDLTLADLDAFPIWEFALDEEEHPEQDETWVRPIRRKKVPQNAYSQIVATHFVTASKDALDGFMVGTTADDGVQITPGALISERYLVLPMVSCQTTFQEKLTWPIKVRDNLLSHFKVLETDFFPLRYCLRVCISGEASVREGLIE